MSRIAAVILAAGSSRRLGRPKQLLMLDGMPLIAHVVDRACTSSLDDVIVVTGAHADAVEDALANRNVRLVRNPAFELGQGTSLAAGIASLDADIEAAVILLGDQPGIASTTIDRVVAAHLATGAPVVMARYGDSRGHPVLFGSALFPDLCRLDGDTGGRQIVQAHRDTLVLVDGGADSPPPDVDTEEAWTALQRNWKGSRPA